MLCPRCASSLSDRATECEVCGATLPVAPVTAAAPAAAAPVSSASPEVNRPTGDAPRAARTGAVKVAQTSSLAVVGLILSILGLFCGLTAIPGLVMSIVALAQCRKSRGEVTGQGVAVAGIIIGAAAVLIYLGLTALYMIGTQIAK